MGTPGTFPLYKWCSFARPPPSLTTLWILPHSGNVAVLRGQSTAKEPFEPWRSNHSCGGISSHGLFHTPCGLLHCGDHLRSTAHEPFEHGSFLHCMDNLHCGDIHCQGQFLIIVTHVKQGETPPQWHLVLYGTFLCFSTAMEMPCHNRHLPSLGPWRCPPHHPKAPTSLRRDPIPLLP